MMSKPEFRPQAWLAADLDQDRSWVHRLSADAVAGVEAALAAAKQVAKPMLEMTADDFPLNAAARDALARAFDATQGRFGLCLLKGFPVERWTEDEAKLVYWGIGLHVGVARTQNRASNVMTDVRNEGGSYKTKNGRGYNTNAGLDFHMDSCDVVALLCLQTAKSGGESKIVSSMALRDAIARERPDLIPVLQSAYFHSYQGTQDPAQPPFYRCPILGSDDTYFSFRTNRKNTTAAQRDFDDVPRLSDAQSEALDLLDTLMPDPTYCFSMWLERGDLQLLNNYVILHSRTNFEDHDEPERRRHLLRLWLAIPGSQPLPPEWREYYGDVRPGAVRGGVRGSAITEAFLDYERRQAQRMDMPLGL
ncbi:TauD/TfdA family dioxygenase [Alcaligenaceae bacterium B3P038]|nr:TauD/TfdA family dioxygenase [Alcaligenaceae bacterium B3P038]